MSNITDQHLPAGLSPRQNPLPNFRSAAYVREQAFSAHESLDTGLVIQTKEGDQVTLTSSSFAQMDAFLYDSKGMVQTESGTALVSQNYREISLASGQSFSFSVAGDLSEDELADIEAILKGLDEVISEMTEGDMFGAIDKALDMGGYDSVSSFAANISYQRSYAMSSAVAASTTQSFPTGEGGVEEVNLPAPEVSPETEESRGGKNNPIADFDKFFKKVFNQLEAHGHNKLANAKNPINKLFDHHLAKTEELGDGKESVQSALETAREKINSLIEEMVNNLFDEELTAAEEEME